MKQLDPTKGATARALKKVPEKGGSEFNIAEFNIVCFILKWVNGHPSGKLFAAIFSLTNLDWTDEDLQQKLFNFISDFPRKDSPDIAPFFISLQSKLKNTPDNAASAFGDDIASPRAAPKIIPFQHKDGKYGT